MVVRMSVEHPTSVRFAPATPTFMKTCATCDRELPEKKFSLSHKTWGNEDICDDCTDAVLHGDEEPLVFE